MRKPWIVALTLLAVTSVACSGGGGGETKNGFSLVKKDTLTVGTELPAPPFYNQTDYGTMGDGLEADLAKEIGKRIGVSKVVLVRMPFDGLVTGAKCKCDFDFSQVTINDKRKQVVDFSTPYFDADQGVLVNKGTKVPDLAAAKKLKWGAQVTTTGFDKVKEITGSDPQGFPDVTAAFTALKAKQIDAVMLDVPIVAGEAAKPGSTFEVVGRFPSGEQYGAVLAKGSADTTALDAIITTLVKEGFIAGLVTKYFPAAAGVPEIK